MNMELESLLSFKQTYFEPRCVLILTMEKKIQLKRLVDLNCSESESEVALNRTEMYANYNQEHPGFFDADVRLIGQYFFQDSFLLSNTATGNRSGMSHLSITSFIIKIYA